MWRRGALSHHLLPRALSQGRARSHSPCLQLPSTVTKVRLCRAALHPGHLRASVHQGGATAEDARTGGLAGNWQAVHCQLSERVSSGLFPQLLEKKKKNQSTHTAIGEGNGYPFQYPCLENSMDRGAWRAAAHGVTKSRTRLSRFNSHTLLGAALSRSVPWALVDNIVLHFSGLRPP